MHERYIPTNASGRLVWLIEECAEVQKCASKIMRFGHWYHYPPSSPPNIFKLLDEMKDAITAMDKVSQDLIEEVRMHEEKMGKNVGVRL